MVETVVEADRLSFLGHQHFHLWECIPPAQVAYCNMPGDISRLS